MQSISLTAQEFNALLTAFFDVAPDHVGSKTFHADIKRVGSALLEALKEQPTATISELEARAEELLKESDDAEAHENEHRFDAHEYGLTRAA